MPRATVTFHELTQDTQDIATNDPNQQHMLSKASFTLDIGGQRYSDMSVVLHHPFGTDYVTEPIGAEPPVGSYQGNWNHHQFREAAEDYYRSAVGSQGSGIRVGPNVQGLRMRNNRFVFSKSYQLDIPD
jgi:hypothetical protein